MTLIDNVIQAGSSAGTQCLQWVNNITHGAGAGFGTAADLASYAKTNGLLHQTPQLGDVAVWGNGVNGALSAGHAGVVTGVTNGVQVTSTNWPGGQGATQYTVGAGNNPVGMGAPSGYVNPNAIGGHNIIPGGSEGLVSGVPTAVAQAAGTSTTIVGREATDLATAVSRAQTAAGPTSVTNPFAGFTGTVTGFFDWAGQSSLKFSFALDLISIGMIIGGVVLLFRRELGSVGEMLPERAEASSPAPAAATAPSPAPKPARAPSPAPSTQSAPAPAPASQPASPPRGDWKAWTSRSPRRAMA